MTEDIKQTIQEVKPETDLVALANQAAERLEKANEISKQLLERAEKLRVTEILGGRSVAAERQKTQDELDQETANAIITRFKFNK